MGRVEDSNPILRLVHFPATFQQITVWHKTYMCAIKSKDAGGFWGTAIERVPYPTRCH